MVVPILFQFDCTKPVPSWLYQTCSIGSRRGQKRPLLLPWVKSYTHEGGHSLTHGPSSIPRWSLYLCHSCQLDPKSGSVRACNIVPSSDHVSILQQWSCSITAVLCRCLSAAVIACVVSDRLVSPEQLPLPITPVVGPIFGPLSRCFFHKRVFMNEISSSASLDIQLTLLCVWRVDSFIPELEHL